jgi:hypothetical protein
LGEDGNLIAILFKDVTTVLTKILRGLELPRILLEEF